MVEREEPSALVFVCPEMEVAPPKLSPEWIKLLHKSQTAPSQRAPGTVLKTSLDVLAGFYNWDRWLVISVLIICFSGERPYWLWPPTLLQSQNRTWGEKATTFLWTGCKFWVFSGITRYRGNYKSPKGGRNRHKVKGGRNSRWGRRIRIRDWRGIRIRDWWLGGRRRQSCRNKSIWRYSCRPHPLWRESVSPLGRRVDPVWDVRADIPHYWDGSLSQVHGDQLLRPSPLGLGTLSRRQPASRAWQAFCAHFKGSKNIFLLSLMLTDPDGRVSTSRFLLQRSGFHGHLPKME